MVILLDLMMPVRTGWDFRREQLADPALREIPVVIVTAKDLTSKDREVLTGAAQHVIQKATDPSRLVAEVLRAVEEEKIA